MTASHLLTIAVDESQRARFPDESEEDWLNWTVQCLAPNLCNGWVECGQDHVHNGHTAGVDECDCDGGCACDDSPTGCTCAFVGCDEFEFHGERHVPGNSGVWALPYPGCVVRGSDWELPDDLDTRVGAWLVQDEWDAYDCCALTVVRDVTDEEVPA